MFKTSLPAGILNKSRILMAKQFGSETQNILSQMLFDDNATVLTTFDLNRIASFTFGDVVCGEIFDVLEYTLRNPLEFTVLSLHKTLVLLHHLAVYASQKAANNVWILRSFIKPLMEYNTVLMAMEQPSSLMAKMQKIKGGSVDKGQPVREAAKALWDLLSDVALFKRVRESSADPDSLVPVGDHDQVGFVSDDVRKAALEEQKRKRDEVKIKSNLKDGGTGGFGSGSNTVVGAAHSIEEMLKIAMKNKSGYRDGDLSEEEKAHMELLRQLEQEVRQQKLNGSSPDKIGVETKVVDLLDFGSDDDALEKPIEKSKSIDSLPYKSTNNEDPFLFDAVGNDDLSNDVAVDHEHDILGLENFKPSQVHRSTAAATHHDPFDILSAPSTAPISLPAGPMNTYPKSHEMDLLSLSVGGMGLESTHQSAVSALSVNHQDIPPMPSWVPPTPPEELSLRPSTTDPFSSLVSDVQSLNAAKSPDLDNKQWNGLNSNPMNVQSMGMNPMMMQTAIQNMSSEQQTRMMQEMMTMNQQMMAQILKLQAGQSSTDQNQGNGNC
mmetsp:Transcript_11510/g.21513  ORF Transcript_11510/g.21513 Transcript_11510/m.21513 type:complete len:551 (+) Transcript_11510:787-2439(+)